MNKKIKSSLKDRVSTPGQAVRIIADNMIKTRPHGEVRYTPYMKNELVYDEPPLVMRRINLKAIHPNVKDGDYAYVKTNLRAADDYDITLHTHGFVKVWLNGTEVCDMSQASESVEKTHPVKLNKGDNELIIKCVCRNGEFSFRFMPAVRIYYMWAKDYIAHVSSLSPVEEYKYEEGVSVSRLYSADEEYTDETVYPMATRMDNILDFNRLYGDTEGEYAYALTYAAENTKISLNTDCDMSVIINGENIGSRSEVILNKGDMLLVKLHRNKTWRLEFGIDANIEIPWLTSSRKHGDKWLLLGSFGKLAALKGGPEYEIKKSSPYIDASGNRIFWRLNDGSYIRPYIDACFYSQWFYALMVGHFGLLDAAKYLNAEKYLSYFTDSIGSISKFYEHMQYEAKEFSQSSFLQKSHEPDNLDETGTMGMNLAELYKINPTSDTRLLLEYLAAAVMHNIPRFPEGTFRRPDTMWADDTYMSCPFLVRMAQVSGDDKYYKECVKQLLGFRDRLYMKDEKLFSHIYFTETGELNRIPWGRGNGWVFNTLSDVLINLPEETEGYSEIMELYKDFAEGIRACLDDCGLWHQVMNIPESYTETSATGMFLLGICRGVRRGWLGSEYIDIAHRVYKALISEKLDSDGNVYDVCMGSSRSMDARYYIELPTIDNDDHGTGIILSSFCEYSMLCKEV